MGKSLPKPQLWQICVLSSSARGLWSNSSSSLPEVWLSFGAEILAGVLVVCWPWREGCTAVLGKVKALRCLGLLLLEGDIKLSLSSGMSPGVPSVWRFLH